MDFLLDVLLLAMAASVMAALPAVSRFGQGQPH
jgi:hypothetical protein